jgi:hypothetical protein
MDSEDKCGKFFSIEETDDGYTVHIKGDKAKLKAKIEALEAYVEYRKKAKAAGFGPMHGHHGPGCGPLSSMMQKHMDMMWQCFHPEQDDKDKE